MLQEESDLSLIIAQIVQKLKGSNLYAQLERQAWSCLQRPEIRLESLKEDIKEFFKISGWEKKLQNAVYSELNVGLLTVSEGEFMAILVGTKTAGGLAQCWSNS
uniref:TBC1 domain family, member 19 n=1 Tax=Mus musculus TaxID=10090 RepID=A0A0J9YU68_MOUSE